MTGPAIMKRYRQYSRPSIFRHMKKPTGDIIEDKRKQNCGRPRLLTARDKRSILKQIPWIRKSKGGNFRFKDIRDGSGISNDISDITVRRVLYNAGYGFFIAPRKGILNANDAQKRLKFAKHAKRTLKEDVWIKDIRFYLDFKKLLFLSQTYFCFPCAVKGTLIYTITNKVIRMSSHFLFHGYITVTHLLHRHM